MKPSDWNWDDFNTLNVLIVGDVMLDRYLSGAVERISPEAPVPVVNMTGQEARLGGAANVALNIQAMGATPYLCSVVGDDAAGAEFIQLMAGSGLWSEGIIRSPGRITTAKTRVMAGGQHLLRIDEEQTDDILLEEGRRLFESVQALLNSIKVDVVIFQDYNKGVLTPEVIGAVLESARLHAVPTAVDPKDKNFWAYRGATLFKPNLREIRGQVPFEISPDSTALDAVATYMRGKLNHSITMITLSEKGLYVEERGESRLIPTHPRVIADVSGAGDTVISVAALGLALGMAPAVFAALSNLAGGQVCEKPGVVPVHKAQLEREYRQFLAK